MESTEFTNEARKRGIKSTVVLGIAAGATLCGMRGYKAMSDWADALGPKAGERFDCRRENGRFIIPTEYVIRDCLVRIEPGTLAIDGKTMEEAEEAVDETRRQIQIGHESKSCYAQKKQVLWRWRAAMS